MRTEHTVRGAAMNKYTVVILDAEQLRATRAADVKGWPQPWALAAIFANSPCPYAWKWDNDSNVPAVARLLRSKSCLTATLVYRTPEVA